MKSDSSGIREYRACDFFYFFFFKSFAMRLLKKSRVPSSGRLAGTVMQSLKARWPCKCTVTAAEVAAETPLFRPTKNGNNIPQSLLSALV